MVLLTDTLRRKMAKDQRGLCFYCHLHLRDDMTWEHLVPKSHRGNDKISNLRVAHQTCNAKCVGSLPIAWKWALHDIGRMHGSDAFFLLASRAQDMARKGTLPTLVRARRPKRPPLRVHRKNIEMLVSFLPDELLAA